MKYTDEQRQWLRDNSYKYSTRELKDLFNETFGTHRKLDAIRTICNYYKMPFKKTSFAEFSEEQSQWLKDNINKYSYHNLTIKFNETFKTEYTDSIVKYECYKLKLAKTPIFKKRYTKEQNEWLSKNISLYSSFQELTQAFNEKFNTAIKFTTLRDYCQKQLKLHINSNNGHFVKGAAVKAKTYDLYEEKVRDGYIHIKINNKRSDGKTTYSDYKENWQPKHRYIYEQHYGKIPDNHIVVFLDRDKTNFDIKNLYCISRSINAIMNKNQWFTDDPVLNLTAIRYCELLFAIKNSR